MNEQISEMINAIGKTSVTKILAMIINFFVYAVALKGLGINFALVHASVLLFMNIFKAGCSFHAISVGSGAYEYFSSDVLVRLLLACVWVFFISVSSESYFFLLSLLGLPLSIIWLKSFDKHMAGEFSGTLMLSGTPVITSLLVSILVFLGLSEVNLLVDKSKYLMFTMVFSIIFGIYFLYEKKLNILSELMNSSISPLLLIFISSLMLGVNEWMYILLFKAAESLSQLITFVLAGIRNKKNLISSLKINFDMVVAAGLIIVVSTYHFAKYDLVILLGVWTIFYAMSAYFFIKDDRGKSIYYISISFFLIYIGSSFIPKSMPTILMIHIIFWILLRSKYINNLIGIFNVRVQ